MLSGCTHVQVAASYMMRESEEVKKQWPPPDKHYRDMRTAILDNKELFDVKQALAVVDAAKGSGALVVSGAPGSTGMTIALHIMSIE